MRQPSQCAHVTQNNAIFLERTARSRTRKRTRGKSKMRNFYQWNKGEMITIGLKASVKLSVLERARFLFFTSTRGTNDQLFNKKKTQSENYRKEVNTLKMGNWKTQTITSFDISCKIYCSVTKRFATDTTWLASGLRLSPSVWKGTDNLLPVITKFTLSSENVPPNKA